jgi:hypothetical protein
MGKEGEATVVVEPGASRRPIRKGEYFHRRMQTPLKIEESFHG